MINRLMAVMFVAVGFSGCVSTQLTPSEAAISQLRAIAIIPIEATPILAHPNNDTERMALAVFNSAGQRSSSDVPLLLPSPHAAMGAAIVTGVGILASSRPSAGETFPVESTRPESWMLTAVMARRASELLSRPPTREAFVVEGYAQLPVADRSVNPMMENWLAPVRRWYNADPSQLNYGQPGPPKADAILEVGVLVQEYIFDRLMSSVMVKLVDPSTQKVIGRAREFTMSEKAKPLSEMLANDGQPLRDLAAAQGQALLLKCLKDIELLPR